MEFPKKYCINFPGYSAKFCCKKNQLCKIIERSSFTKKLSAEKFLQSLIIIFLLVKLEHLGNKNIC